jgi:hypothetical protein
MGSVARRERVNHRSRSVVAELIGAPTAEAQRERAQNRAGSDARERQRTTARTSTVRRCARAARARTCPPARLCACGPRSRARDRRRVYGRPGRLRDLPPALPLQPGLRRRALRRHRPELHHGRRIPFVFRAVLRVGPLARVPRARRLYGRKRALRRRKLRGRMHARRGVPAPSRVRFGHLRRERLQLGPRVRLVLGDGRTRCVETACILSCSDDAECDIERFEICSGGQCLFAGCESDAECRAYLALYDSFGNTQAVCR